MNGWRGGATRGAAPLLVPLTTAEALSCRGGGDYNPIKELLDWITGKPPEPGQWPPQIG